VFAYEANSQEGGYVNGVIAASLSESFVAGAEATNPDVTVNVNWIGSFSDVALAAEAANTHIGAGADVLTGTAQMVVGAIGVAEENGALWFGTQSSQTSLAPDIVVANQVYDWTVALDEMISLIQEGTYGGKAYTITLANGGLLMDYNSNYDLPADVKALADEAVKGIIDGSIAIPVE
jgi:basic membrane protein A